jgi:hypothetical protein
MGGAILMNKSPFTSFTIIIFLYFSITQLVFSAEELINNNFNLKAGASLGRFHLISDLIPEENKSEDSTENSGYGINTSVGYKWNSWEILVASDLLFGKLNDLTFQVDSTQIRGDGNFRVFSLVPMIRYYTPYTLYNRWNFFVEAGPSWSLHTFIISNNLNGSNFNDKKRISFENRGGSINVGLEEIVPFKEMHPTFIQFGYSFMQSKQIFIVDATDFTDVKTLSKGNSRDFNGHYFVARFGITLF